MNQELTKADYDMIIEKMRRKHSKYRGLQKPALRSVKKCKDLAQVRILNALRTPEYRRVLDQLPDRLKQDINKHEYLTVKTIRSMRIHRHHEEADNERIKQAVHFSIDWMNEQLGLTPLDIKEFMNTLRNPEIFQKEEGMRAIQDEVFSLLLPQRFEELHDIGISTPKRVVELEEFKNFQEINDYFIKH